MATMAEQRARSAAVNCPRKSGRAERARVAARNLRAVRMADHRPTNSQLGVLDLDDLPVPVAFLPLRLVKYGPRNFVAVVVWCSPPFKRGDERDVTTKRHAMAKKETTRDAIQCTLVPGANAWDPCVLEGLVVRNPGPRLLEDLRPRAFNGT